MKNIYSCCKTILTLTFTGCLFLKSAFGQVPVVNTNTVIKAEAGTTLFVDGSLTQQTIATINNNGTIVLTGDFTNNTANNCFGVSTGTVNLTGGIQNIGGTGITAFNNLNLAGTGKKVLTQSIITGGANGINSGVLNLGSQLLDLNSKKLTVSNKLPGGISRTSGFIQSETDALAGYGTIQWQIGNSGPGNYEFPFGNIATASYLPYNFSIVTPGFNGGAIGSVSLSTYPTNTSATPNNRAFPTGVTHLKNALNLDNSDKVLDRYWVMDVTGFSTQPTANISMTYRSGEHDLSGGSTNVINESQLAAQRWDGIQWLAQTGTVDVTNNKVSVSNVNSFNTVWTLVASSSPLPVELLNFNANLNKSNMVDLVWATATEINNDYFTMERSSNGITFESIGTVDGAGNSSSNLFYSGLDPKPFQGITYYRLKQTDFDGKFSYSQIVPVTLSNESHVTTQLNVYPNPAVDFINVQLSDESVNANSVLEIFNAIGQVVYSDKIGNLDTKANNVYQVSTGRFSAGLYMVRIMNGDEIVGSQKLLKK